MNQFKIEVLNEPKQELLIERYLYVGSDITCGLYIENNSVEKKHALLEQKEDKIFIKDLRSQTGVFVNGARILEARLQDGDVIRIGEVELLAHDLSVNKPQFSLQSLNESWQKQLIKLAHTAQTHFPILLLGPSGTGKDVIAQALHHHSQQSRQVFLSVNCSALTETLIESELFGHVKGSFTGAISDRKGAFETARNGTLFLDEIGDLPYSLQAKLLRALENNEIRAVGSDRAIKTNVRIIAATHQNLYQKIQEGSFRSDLFYRLNVVTIEVPKLT
ncbi:MAG: sigma-54-dependent Fis family transcriptional regulator, partial [Pseudobdellovibrio sp.]